MVLGPGARRPILYAPASPNQMFPSDPTAMPAGIAFEVGIGNSVTARAGEIRPISLRKSVNQRFPSGPAASPVTVAFTPSTTGSANSVITPAKVIRPILATLVSLNHTLPSGPVAITVGCASGVGNVYSPAWYVGPSVVM